MSLNSDFQKLYVDGLIHLYELDASSLGAGILRFHGHIAFQDWEKSTRQLAQMALLVSILAALERFLIPVIKSMEPKYYLAGSGF